MSQGLGLIKRLMLELAAVAGCATCLSIGAAKADPISFGPGDTNAAFFSPGDGSLTMNLASSTGPATIGAPPPPPGGPGMFTLSEPPGGATYEVLNFNGTGFSVSGPSEPFSFKENGNSLTGVITWTSLVDNDPTNNLLVGRLTNVAITGSADPNFLAEWTVALQPGGFGTVQWQIVGNGTSLINLSHSTNFVQLRTALGEIEPVPAPIVGAGLPGLIFTGAGLLAWLRRKRTAVAAA